MNSNASDQNKDEKICLDNNDVQRIISDWLQHNVMGARKKLGVSLNGLFNFTNKLKLFSTNINSLWVTSDQASDLEIVSTLGLEKKYWQNLAQETDLEYLKIVLLPHEGDETQAAKKASLGSSGCSNSQQVNNQMISGVSEKPSISMGILPKANTPDDVTRSIDINRPESIGRIKDHVLEPNNTVVDLPAKIQIHALGPQQNLGFINNSKNELFEWLEIPAIHQSSDSSIIKQKITERLTLIQQKMDQQKIDKIQVIVGPDNTAKQLQDLRKIVGPQVETIFSPQAQVVPPVVFTRQIKQKFAAMSLPRAGFITAKKSEPGRNDALLGNNGLSAGNDPDASAVEFVFPEAMSAASKQDVLQQTFSTASIISNANTSQIQNVQMPNMSPAFFRTSERAGIPESQSRSEQNAAVGVEPLLGKPFIDKTKNKLFFPNNMPFGMESQLSSQGYKDAPLLVQKPVFNPTQSNDGKQGIIDEISSIAQNPQLPPRFIPEQVEGEVHPSMGNMEFIEMPNSDKSNFQNNPESQSFPINSLPNSVPRQSTMIPDINHIHFSLPMLSASETVPAAGSQSMSMSMSMSMPARQASPSFVFPETISEKKEINRVMPAPMSSLIFLATQNKVHKSQENILANSEPQILRRSINRAAPIQMAAKDRTAGEVMDNTKVSGQEKTVSMLAQAFYRWYQNQEQLTQEQSFRSVGLWR